MAQTIYIKNSEVAGVTPSSLGKGEIAINIADGNLFYGDSGGNVSQKFSFIHSGATSIGALTATSGTFRSHVNISGDTRTDGKLYVGDGSGLYTDKIRRFTANDNTTKILLNSNVIKIHAGHSTDELVNLAGSEVAIDGALTTNSGITSIGNIHVSADTYFADNSQAIFGNGSDLKIYHSGSHSIIQEAGTGNLLLKGGAVKIMGTTTGEDCAVFTENAGVELYYNDVKRFETNSDGVNVNAFTATSGNFRSNVNVSGTTTLTTVDINGGTINADTITVDAEKTITIAAEGILNVAEGLLETSPAQNKAIVQGSGGNVDFGNYIVRSSTFYADVATGTAPFTVASTTVVPNLHAASATSVMTNANLTGDITSVGNATSIASGVIINADVKSDAAIDYSKLAALSDGNILVGNGSNVATSVNPSGDIDVTNAGVFSIASGVIINADVKSDAAIEQTKLDTNVDLGGDITFGNQLDDTVYFKGDVSAATVSGSYQYVSFFASVAGSYMTTNDWIVPSAGGGISNHTWNNNTNYLGSNNTVGTSNFTPGNGQAHLGIPVPVTGFLEGFFCNCRNNGGASNPRNGGLFVGTNDWGVGANAYTLRAYAAGDDEGGSSNSKVYKIDGMLTTGYPVTKGDIVLPALYSPDSDSVAMNCTWTVVFKA